jgi:hypothetical protein
LVPLLGVTLVVAMARTWTMLRAGGTLARPSAAKAWGVSLLGSLGVLALITSTSTAAFFAICLPLGATQHPVSEVPPVPLFYDAAWLLGGMAAAVIATLSLDLLWLEPLSQRLQHGSLPTRSDFSSP